MSALMVCLGLAFPAQATPITVFSLQFTLTNQTADGFAITADSGQTLILTGGNTGSGIGGTTDLVTTATGAGIVSFHFLYSSLDPTPGFDLAGYLLQGAFTQLADTDGTSGNVSFAVGLGQSFGFRVTTLDNEGEPGVVTISNFTAPGSSGSVPEPGTLLLGLTGAVVLMAYKYKTRAQRMFHTGPGRVLAKDATLGDINQVAFRKADPRIALITQVPQ